MRRRRQIGPASLLLLTAMLVVSSAPRSLGREKTPEEVLRDFTLEQDQRRREGRELLSLEDLIDRYPDTFKREILRRFATSPVAYFPPIRGRWDLIDAPDVALPWALHEEEPFPEKVMAVLAKTFPHSKDPDERLKMAALLYRYGQAAGHQHLLQALRTSRNMEAAYTFALNREREALPAIREILKQATPRLRREFVYALGRWGPETTALLTEGLHGTPDRSLQVDYIRALTLAEHRVSAAVLERARWFYGGQASGKAEAAAWLARLNPQDRAPLDYLWARVGQWRDLSEAEQRFIVQGLSELPQIDPARLRKLLREVVESYAAKKDFAHVMWSQIEAARTLARIGTESEKQLLVQMLRKMITEGSSQPRDVQDVAQAVHDSGLPETEQVLAELMGAGFVPKLRALRQLRPLPPEWIPVTSRLFAPRSYVE